MGESSETVTASVVLSRRASAAWVAVVALALAALCGLRGTVSSLSAHSSRTLTARVVDDVTGAPLAARVAVTDVHGVHLPIVGVHEHVRQLGKQWDYVDGAFTVPLPAEGAMVEIRRGLETRPLTEHIGASASDEETRTFRLRRWSNLRARGYVSGDIHAHLPALEAADLQMRAEDLDDLNLLILGGLPLPNDKSFEGHADHRSSADHQVYLSQEVIDWHLGHLTLAGVKSLIPGYPGPCGTLEYSANRPHCDVYRAGREARRQGALVSLAHFENLPGAATPVAVALGLLDALEIPTWSDPMQLPAHLTPWEASGMSTADFTPMRGVDLYYQYLNAGFRLPIAAGTDKSSEDIPIGSNRVYVQTNGSSDFAAWLAGVKAGTGFVSNGPLLEFDVDGHAAGEVVVFHGEKTVKVRATARSLLPFTTLEVVLNGRPVVHTLKLVQTNPPVDGVYSLETEASVRLTESSWLAARAFADPDLTPRLLPRESSVFSHTNAVAFLRDGRNVRDEASILYLRKSIKALLHWLSTGPAFASEADRAAVERDAAKALRLYEAM